MRILYFDCPSGISGDMCLGALVDLGVDIKRIRSELKKLPIEDVSISISRKKYHGITGTNLCIKTKEAHHHRTFRDIKELIEESGLSRKVKELSVEIFKEIAQAEAKVHDTDYMEVHFHEVGALDSIVDIVGTAVAMEAIDVDEVYSSPLPMGTGWVDTAHGRMPVPAPATVEILRGVPVKGSHIEAELTTPTGASIVKTLARGFCTMPSMVIEATGYGLGSRNLKEIPNILRVVVGRTREEKEVLVVMETNIDDMNPQIMGYLTERLLSAGALDVFCTSVQMKKNRPGVLLTVLTDRAHRDQLMDIIFRESTSLGVRIHEVERVCLSRKDTKVSTPYGTVRMKVSLLDGKVVNIQPEYEDCKRIAQKSNIPVKTVMDEAKRCFRG